MSHISSLTSSHSSIRRDASNYQQLLEEGGISSLFRNYNEILDDAANQGFSKNDVHLNLKNSTSNTNIIKLSDIYFLINKLHERGYLNTEGKFKLFDKVYLIEAVDYEKLYDDIINELKTSDDKLNNEKFTVVKLFISFAALIASINTFLAGSGVSNLFSTDKIYNLVTDMSPSVIGYVVGFFAAIMTAKSFLSVNPAFTSLPNCIYALLQGIPSATFTYSNTQKLMLLYTSFLESIELPAKITFVGANYIFNVLFGLGLTQSLIKQIKYIYLSFQVENTNKERGGLILNIVFSVLLSVLVTYPYFDSLYTLLNGYLYPALGGFGSALSGITACVLNPAEFMFHFGSIMTWTSVTISNFKTVYNKGIKYTLKILYNQNSGLKKFIYSAISFVGAACSTEILREILVDKIDMENEKNRWAFKAGLITHFFAAFTGNRGAFD